MATSTYTLIKQLKDDLDRRLDDIASRLVRIETQYADTINRIVKIETKMDMYDKDFAEHCVDEKEYGRELHSKISALEKKQGEEKEQTIEIKTKVYIIFGVLTAFIAAAVSAIAKYLVR